MSSVSFSNAALWACDVPDGRLLALKGPAGNASDGRLLVPKGPAGDASDRRLLVPKGPAGDASDGRLLVPPAGRCSSVEIQNNC